MNSKLSLPLAERKESNALTDNSQSQHMVTENNSVTSVQKVIGKAGSNKLVEFSSIRESTSSKNAMLVNDDYESDFNDAEEEAK